ncbi:small GTP-binding protein [Histomonas meleagridis]|uniref:small GTP-binding protein n=1 Tax=Histomonas meleagridis TaxID=135588 RepID=UPI00355A8902|nr:small GTP-binding protein [Histomonas meleagridis]KAH0800698.1 small GTP-binding protein [Histomonas meleagridis]
MSDSKELKLVLIGNSYVGKTCVVKKATSGVFTEDTTATLGASYVSKLINVGNIEVRLQIWDTAGQERYRGMTPMYYRGAHIALIVYSITDRESFEGIDGWYESLRENTDSDILIFLVGNKYDLEESREISTEEGQAKADSIRAHFYEVSAKTNYGIDDLFNDIPRIFFEKQTDTETKKDSSVEITKTQKQRKPWYSRC